MENNEVFEDVMEDINDVDTLEKGVDNVIVDAEKAQQDFEEGEDEADENSDNDGNSTVKDMLIGGAITAVGIGITVWVGKQIKYHKIGKKLAKNGVDIEKLIEEQCDKTKVEDDDKDKDDKEVEKPKISILKKKQK